MKSNNEQEHAINSNERTILCLAGAGAGKSYSLVHRIKRLMEQGTLSNQILALTFTNAAAAEMEEKFKKACNLPIPEFKTFHGFCYSLIVKDKEVRKELGYVDIPEIATDYQLKELHTKTKQLLNCKLSQDVIDGIKQPKDRKEALDLEVYLNRYNKQLMKDNLITFDILCEGVCNMFSTDMNCIQRYKKQYKHILVDEFQDTDPVQFRFVSSFPDTTSVFVVGDAYQGIYAFRGCSDEFIKMLSTAPGWEVIKLYKNYRSTKQICDFANAFSSKYGNASYRIAMEGQRDGDPVVVEPESLLYGDDYSKSTLSKILKHIEEYQGTHAILCRSNREVAAYRHAIEEAGIEVNSSVEDTGAADLLQSAMDNEYMLSYLTCNLLKAAEYQNYIRQITLHPEVEPMKVFLKLYKSNKEVSKAIEKINKIRTILASKMDSKFIYEECAKIAKVKITEDVDYDSLKTPSEIADALIAAAQQKENKQVFVGTIHSSKGLEYDTVYMPGVGTKSFDLSTEELKNLYYVGVTRAKEHLFIYKYIE